MNAMSGRRIDLDQYVQQDTAPPSEIVSEVQRLDETVIRMAQVIDQLSQRLSMVLRPDVPHADANPPSILRSTEMGMHLTGIADQLQGVVERTSAIISRLEI